MEERVLDVAQCDPTISVRRLSNRVGESVSRVWRTIRDEGFYPCHLQRVQALQPDDYDLCPVLPAGDNHILFSDEAQFSRVGMRTGEISVCASPINLTVDRVGEFFVQSDWTIRVGTMFNCLLLSKFTDEGIATFNAGCASGDKAQESSFRTMGPLHIWAVKLRLSLISVTKIVKLAVLVH